MKNKKVLKRFFWQGKKAVIRYSEFSDWPDFLALNNALVKEKAYISVQKKRRPEQVRKWLKAALKSVRKKEKILLVLEVGGKVTGNALIEKADRSSQSHIGNFGIILGQEARGIGLSKEIFQAIQKEAKVKLGLKIIKLNACSANKRALSFYKKMGFKEIGRVKKGVKHYGRYLDEVLMVKYL